MMKPHSAALTITTLVPNWPMLTDLMAKIETGHQQIAAMRRGVQAVAGEGERAAVSGRDIETEIQRLNGLLLADTAVVSVPGADRMTPDRRVETEQQLAALRARRAALDAQPGRSVEDAAALGQVAADREREMLPLYREFRMAFRTLSRALEPQFRRDMINLPLPQLIQRWLAIYTGLGQLGSVDALREIRVMVSGVPVLASLRYRDMDTGEEIDLAAVWRRDPALVALSDALAGAAAVSRRVIPHVDAADAAARSERSADEVAAWFASFDRPAASPPSEAAAAPAQPSDIKFSVGYNGTNIGGPRAGFGIPRVA